jgi:hypothetical protein
MAQPTLRRYHPTRTYCSHASCNEADTETVVCVVCRVCRVCCVRPGYYKCFAGVSLVDICVPYVKLQTLTWDPLAPSTRTFEDLAWYSTLSTYGLAPTAQVSLPLSSHVSCVSCRVCRVSCRVSCRVCGGACRVCRAVRVLMLVCVGAGGRGEE